MIREFDQIVFHKTVEHFDLNSLGRVIYEALVYRSGLTVRATPASLNHLERLLPLLTAEMKSLNSSISVIPPMLASGFTGAL